MSAPFAVRWHFHKVPRFPARPPIDPAIEFTTTDDGGW